MAEYSVLIIDDDIWMQRILTKTMESYGFRQTLLASNAFEGIALAVEHLPMLIVMDILMPELSGLIALKILKHIKYTNSIPIIMVSALSDTENLSMAFKYGTAGFISKPFTRSTVYEKLIHIFSKERLDKISKGEPVDMDFEYPAEPDIDIFGTLTEPREAGMTETSDETAERKHQKVIPPEQLLHYYQEDEKRSIDAIKKMLLKNRK